MTGPRQLGWIGTLPSRALRRAMQLGQFVTGPELHLTRVIMRAANQARSYRARNAAALLSSRKEQ